MELHRYLNCIYLVLTSPLLVTSEPLAKITVAVERARARAKLKIETDLRGSASHLRSWMSDEDCATNANVTFDDAITTLSLTGELTDEEKGNFKARFIEEMVADCKYDPEVAEHWATSAAAGLEHQKPVITQAFAESVNNADLGFKVEVRDWMRNQSKLDFDNLLGMDPSLANPQNSSSLLQRVVGKPIPEVFDSATKIAACANTVKRIHNQGTCGSCWAFGTLSALDSRLCIATNGAFSGPKAALSRGYATSCSTPGTLNGCDGGWWSFVYNLLGEGIHCDGRGGNCKSSGFPGIVTGLANGCVPYFGHGSGVDHFDSKHSAPPCQDQCVKQTPAYPRPLSSDLYVMPGGMNWASRAVEFEGYTSAQNAQMARQAIYEKGPIPFAVHADNVFKGYSSGVLRGECQNIPNHCVTAIGYGLDYFDSLNSWGPKWGNDGGFKIADCLATHWSIPGDMPSTGFPEVLTDSNAGQGPVLAPDPVVEPVKMVPVWAVSSGPCTVDGSGCLLSPYYLAGDEEYDPSECETKANTYGPNETCTFEILTSVSPAIEVVDFSTERGFDIFTVNGIGYSGGGNDTEDLQGTVPTSMYWQSDKGFEKTGWKLCPRDPRMDMTPAGRFISKDGVKRSLFVARKDEEDAQSPWPGFQEAGSFTSKTGKPFSIYVSSSGSLAAR